MNDLLNSLLKALEYSPDNIELRLQIVKIYMDQFLFDEAESHLISILEKDCIEKWPFTFIEREEASRS